MRTALWIIALLALATLASPETLRGALAAAAGALFESTPFLVGGMLIAYRLRRFRHAVAYLGCGCGAGPTARSLPAAAATAMLFGPWVAILRFGAAVAVSRLIRETTARCPAAATEYPNLLAELGAVLPAALLAGLAMQLFGWIDPKGLPPVVSALLGAGLGFSAAPCALGAVPLAGVLRSAAPPAAIAFFCIAGIADLRTFSHRAHANAGHDAFAYTLLAVALSLVAARHGGSLVHPLIAPALGFCAFLAFIAAIAFRRTRSPRARAAPLLMLAGALVGATPPEYRATETTMTDLFAGERLRFTGTLANDGTASALVRYAITCCRADAAPVVVRLSIAPHYARGTWLRADGQIESTHGELRLAPETLERIAPPSDPFIYR